MKKLPLFLAFLFLHLTACAGNAAIDGTDSGEGTNTVRVVSTMFAAYDFTRQLAGGQVELTMLLPPAVESHHYEPTAQDMLLLQDCDVFIYVGGESDVWADTLLASLDQSDMRILKLMDCVETVEEELSEGMESGEQGHGHEEHGAYDEHVWTSPVNAMRIVESIAEILCAADTKNAETYRQNEEAYLAKLGKLDEEFRELTSQAVRNTVVFGDRFPFRYLMDAYGIAYYAAFPGCASETEPNARTLAFLIDKIKSEQIPVVFHIELSNKSIAGMINEATGAKILLLHSCHNVTRNEFSAGVTYLALMEQNLAALKEALWE